MEELFEFVSKGKKIKAGIRVEGKFGPLVANPEAEPGKKSRRILSNATGTVLEAIDAKKWLVKRDQDLEVISVCTCIIRIIYNAVGVPTDEVENEVSNITL